MDKVREVLEKYAKIFGDNYKSKLEAAGYRDLAATVTTSVIRNSGEFGIDINLADYWQWIEYGREPGKFPPVDKMISWVEKCIPSPTPIQVGARQVIPTPNQLAYLVGRKVARDGLEGKYLLSETIEEMQEQFIKELEGAVVSDFTEKILA